MEQEHRRGLEAATQRRERRRSVATVAAGVVVALAVLLGASWLVRPGWQPSRPVRVATRTSAPPGQALMPATPGPGKTRVGNAGAGAESTARREAPEAAGTVSEPPGPPPRAAQSTASQPARRPSREPEATLSQGERPGPESTAQPVPTRAGSDDHEVAAHIEAEPLADGFTSYTVRLHERDGRPVTGATVSIRGRRADGALEEATLDPEAEPGLYRAVVRFTFTEARLRIASVGRVQEIPLPDSPS
jgi:hypothetical protein